MPTTAVLLHDCGNPLVTTNLSRPAFADICGLLEGVGQLKDAPVAVVTAHDLETNGRPLAENAQGTETAGLPAVEM